MSLTSPVDTLIAGINPKGEKGRGHTVYDIDTFLKGNPYWGDRFLPDGTYNPEWRKYISGTRLFLGIGDDRRKPDFDDDTRTVWTNLSPFESRRGSSDLPKELERIGVQAFFELVDILRPERIVLLGKNAFARLKQYDDAQRPIIDYDSVIDNWNGLQIGRIADISAVCVPHPSGHWLVSNKFTSVFIFLFFLADKVENGKVTEPLSEIKEIMRKEFKSWLTQIQFE